MKKWWILALILVLTACGGSRSYETVTDELEQWAIPEPGEPAVSLPESAIGTGGNYWFWEEGEISLQRYPGGDLSATVEKLCGRRLEATACLSRDQQGFTRYDLTWTVLGETGEQICRAAILDDGYYHYTLTAVIPAGGDGEALMDSFSLDQY